MRLASLLSVLVLLTSCQAHHYMVVEDKTPLYEGPHDEVILAHIPRYHHEPLEEDPAEQAGKRVRVVYRGRPGYVQRGAVRVFSYTDPALDGGSAQEEAVQRELREAQLADVGRDWPDRIVQAIREERVLEGMTRRQVEVAWGWPKKVGPSDTGEERWVYLRETYEVERHFVHDPWVADPWLYGPTTGWGWPHWRRPTTSGWVVVRVPVTEERVVVFNAEGRVRKVKVRRILRDD